MFTPEEYASLQSARAQFGKLIRKRDKCCRDCGSTLSLQVHHILPVAVFPQTAFMKMNAVTLCRDCHSKTYSFARPRNKAELALSEVVRKSVGRCSIIVEVIPHRWREYDTIGNWSFAPDGMLVVFVSDTGSRASNEAIAVHEVVEALLCRFHKVSEESVTNFDLKFEKERAEGKHSLDDEPGCDPRAPYRDWHLVAERFEREFLIQACVMWSKHSENCERIYKNGY
jgi:hypothetical protein